MDNNSSLGLRTNITDESSPVVIDFAQSRLKCTHGMTCDGYEARYGRNRVFVKRVKPEHRDNPVILEAFAKELEIGLSLHHQSLPGYLFAGEDYIVMHYVEGDTLADMIWENDKWLNNKRNLRRMFTELVDVLDYLHQNNVVHCDIKPDNVMLTRGARNVMLIDLGEAYTDWLDRTAGDVGRYGLDSHNDKGHPSADFRGLGLLVDRLKKADFPTAGLVRFRRLCNDKDITSDDLREALMPPNRHIAIMVASIIAVMAIVATSTIMMIHRSGSETPARGVKDTVVIINETPTPPSAEDRKPAVPEVPTYKSMIEKGVGKYFEITEDYLGKAERALADPTTSKNELRQLSMDLASWFSRDTQMGCKMYESMFKDVGAVEIQLTFVNSKAFQRINKRVESAVKRMTARLTRDDPETYERYKQYDTDTANDSV